MADQVDSSVASVQAETDQVNLGTDRVVVQTGFAFDQDNQQAGLETQVVQLAFLV